ncbi:hypothetical protein NDU88_005233 [Pleurodeles waltl]|uniref:Uncharacterized protein n=1 Tax=Pleurodeles waltl TaxID=8319 RepID=A0AAV7PHY8_PLEWA|nr:hypothetical protein NDU88_005233 [Pleurodeles waltl]
MVRRATVSGAVLRALWGETGLLLRNLDEVRLGVRLTAGLNVAARGTEHLVDEKDFVSWAARAAAQPGAHASEPNPNQIDETSLQTADDVTWKWPYRWSLGRELEASPH